MALARVQAATAAGGDFFGGTISVTLAAPPTIGHAILVANISGNATACTDNRGNTYLLAVAQLGTFSERTVWYCPAITATGTPFTVTLAGGGFIERRAVVIEVSGVGAGLTVNQTAGQEVGGAQTTALTTATAPLTGAEAVLVALADIGNGISSITVESVSPAWTQEAEGAGANPPGEIDSRILPAAAGATPSCSWTYTPSAGFGATIVAFTLPGGAPAAVETATPFVWGPV